MKSIEWFIHVSKAILLSVISLKSLLYLRLSK